MPTDALHLLVYQSSATVPLQEDTLRAILTVSRAWNTAHSISGVLLYSDGRFLQVLEGPRHEVLGIFAKISTDYRHGNVTKLADGPIDTRNFSDWSMGFMTIATEDFRKLTGYGNPRSPDYQASLARTADETLHQVLLDFVRSEAQQP